MGKTLGDMFRGWVTGADNNVAFSGLIKYEMHPFLGLDGRRHVAVRLELATSAEHYAAIQAGTAQRQIVQFLLDPVRSGKLRAGLEETELTVATLELPEAGKPH